MGRGSWFPANVTFRWDLRAFSALLQRRVRLEASVYFSDCDITPHGSIPTAVVFGEIFKLSSPCYSAESVLAPTKASHSSDHRDTT